MLGLIIREGRIADRQRCKQIGYLLNKTFSERSTRYKCVKPYKELQAALLRTGKPDMYIGASLVLWSTYIEHNRLLSHIEISYYVELKQAD